MKVESDAAVTIGLPRFVVEDFRLLGLSTGLLVCVDAASGAPLQLLGGEPRLGTFTIEATHIETRDR